VAGELYHRIEVRLNGRDVICAVRQERLEKFADGGMTGKVAELHILAGAHRVFRSPTAVYQGLRRPLTAPDAPPWYNERNVVILTRIMHQGGFEGWRV
jgi:hypothetical protein